MDRQPTIIVKNTGNLPTIPWQKLADFQGDLKDITPENLEKLKNSIKAKGFIVPKFVWYNEGQYKLLDGHQTRQALLSLESEGFKIPHIPIWSIEAKDATEAAEILLVLDSRYGTPNPDTTFFTQYNIDLEDIKTKIDIPELYLEFDDKMAEELNQVGNVEPKETKMVDYVRIRCENADGGEVRRWLNQNLYEVFPNVVVE